MYTNNYTNNHIGLTKKYIIWVLQGATYFHKSQIQNIMNNMCNHLQQKSYSQIKNYEILIYKIYK